MSSPLSSISNMNLFESRSTCEHSQEKLTSQSILGNIESASAGSKKKKQPLLRLLQGISITESQAPSQDKSNSLLEIESRISDFLDNERVYITDPMQKQFDFFQKSKDDVLHFTQSSLLLNIFCEEPIHHKDTITTTTTTANRPRFSLQHLQLELQHHSLNFNKTISRDHPSNFKQPSLLASDLDVDNSDEQDDDDDDDEGEEWTHEINESPAPLSSTISMNLLHLSTKKNIKKNSLDLQWDSSVSTLCSAMSSSFQIGSSTLMRKRASSYCFNSKDQSTSLSQQFP